MRVLVLSLILAVPVVVRAQRCDDGPLSLAAADILESGTVDVVAAARSRGSTLPWVRALWVSDRAELRVDTFLEGVSARAGAPIVCGEALSEGRRLVLAGARAATLTLLAGLATVELAEGWREARLYAHDSRGETWEQAVEGGRAEIPSDLTPPIDVQVVATGPDGPRPVADARIGRGRALVIVRSGEPIVVRVDHLREAADAGSLRTNRLLTRGAARHAATICRDGNVAHVVDGADPIERLAREGIVARHVGETAARSSDLEHAYAATLRSPSHWSARAAS